MAELNTFVSPIQRSQALQTSRENIAASKQRRDESAAAQPGILKSRDLSNQAQEQEIARFTEESTLRSMAQGALQFLQIDPNDIERQNEFLKLRAQDIADRGGDPQDTLGMLQLNPAQRQEAARGTIQIAQQSGLTEAPASSRTQRQTAVDAAGRRRFIDTGEVVFQDVDTSGQVTPREKFEFEEAEQTRLSGKLSAASEKALISAQDAAQESDQAVSELLSIATEFENLPEETLAGAAASARETLRSFLGTEDDLTALRRRYNQVKNNQVMQNLPPGVASDKDIEIAMSGFLSDKSNPATAASFLRGLAKIEKINGQFNAFKANFISENNNTKGMFKEWKKQLSGDNPTLDSLSIEDLDNLTVEQLQKLREDNQ